MRRRLFTWAAGSCAALPHAARAQRPAMPVIGYLSGVSRAESGERVAAFRQGLGQAGHTGARNVAIEYRWADGDYGRVAALAAGLVRQSVDVIAAAAGPTAQAARAASSTLPIVFIVGGDPVSLGLAQSLSRPGGNATGVAFLTSELVPKRFELLLQLLPKAKLVAVRVNPNTPSSEEQLHGAEAAARALGVRMLSARAGSEAEIAVAFATLARARPDALLMGADPLFGTRHKRFIALAALHRPPAACEQRNAVVDGGLMSCGTSLTDAYVRTGVDAGRVLAGAKPADLPVLQPTKFERVLNLRNAKALGRSIPQILLLRADEVIE